MHVPTSHHVTCSATQYCREVRAAPTPTVDYNVTRHVVILDCEEGREGQLHVAMQSTTPTDATSASEPHLLDFIPVGGGALPASDLGSFQAAAASRSICFAGDNAVIDDPKMYQQLLWDERYRLKKSG
jgi:hypothetical protein